MTQPQRAEHPTIVHLTHQKAGSQWIHKIFLRCVPADRLVPPEMHEVQFLNRPVIAGAVYPTVYLSWEDYQRVPKPADTRHFFIIRDLRDSVVSQYFSVRFSHADMPEEQFQFFRSELPKLDFEQGMLLLLRQWAPKITAVQQSWVKSGQELIRYEDLLERDREIMLDLFMNRCPLGLTREALEAAIEACRFDRLTGGRSRGQEDIMAHERKGVAGDWRSYFTPAMTDCCKELYGQLLIDSGYERDMEWEA